jgi:hypothetical protein
LAQVNDVYQPSQPIFKGTDMYSIELSLFFCGLRLERIRFSHIRREPIDSVRGKKGKTKENGSFQWSSAVKSLAQLTLQEQLARIVQEPIATLTGNRGSPASALDYALDRQPAWTKVVFGTDREGATLLHLLLERDNPRQKEARPVTITFRPHRRGDLLIQVILDGVNVSNDKAALELLIDHLRESDGDVDEWFGMVG